MLRHIYKDPYWLQEDITDDEKVDKIAEINRLCLGKGGEETCSHPEDPGGLHEPAGPSKKTWTLKVIWGRIRKIPEIADSGDENDDELPSPPELPGETQVDTRRPRRPLLDQWMGQKSPRKLRIFRYPHTGECLRRSQEQRKMTF